MVEYKAAIFDLDGTLIDSLDVWRQIDIDFLGKRGYAVPDDYLKEIACLGFNAAADYTIARFGFSETRESIVREWFNMALYAYSNQVELKNGVKSYLEKLKGQRVKMAIATASDEQLVLPVLKRHGILELFENITTVQEVARGKGFPDVYDKAAQRMQVSPSECIVYEDILQGIQGAKAGGYRAIGVYDVHSAKDMEQMKAQADGYIMDFTNCNFPI